MIFESALRKSFRYLFNNNHVTMHCWKNLFSEPFRKSPSNKPLKKPLMATVTPRIPNISTVAYFIEHEVADEL